MVVVVVVVLVAQQQPQQQQQRRQRREMMPAVSISNIKPSGKPMRVAKAFLIVAAHAGNEFPNDAKQRDCNRWTCISVLTCSMEHAV